jgi:hypothetical protein
MWVVSEIAAMATDLAEFHGALRRSLAGQAAAGIGAVIVLTLNAFLLAETFGISPIG